MADVHEYVVLNFKQDISREAQIEAMTAIGDIVKEFDGFKGRETFYNEPDNRWIEHIIWQDQETANASAQRIVGIPEFLAIAGKMDSSKMIFAFYDRIS